MSDLPNAAIQRLAKKAGAERVGTDATEEIIKKTEIYIENLVKKANAFAIHAGRKTIKKEDIDLAAGQTPTPAKTVPAKK